MRIRTDQVTWQEIDGELVILDLARSTYLTTNATGAFLTKLLVHETSEDDLAAALAAKYDLAVDGARADVRTFAAELDRLGLLVTAAATDAAAD